MKKSIVGIFDKIIIALLGCFAFFTGCDILKDSPCEYGTPTADFEIKGTVTDSITSNALPNIRVIRKNADYPQFGDTIYTDANGKYSFSFQDFPIKEPTFPIKVEDIDGSLNDGDHVSKQVDVVINSTDWVKNGDGHWYYGKAIKIQDFKLTVKK